MNGFSDYHWAVDSTRSTASKAKREREMRECDVATVGLDIHPNPEIDRK